MNGKLEKILEAGNNAPTATNAQPQRIYVIQSEQARAKVEKLLNFIIMPFVLFWFVIRRGNWFGPNNGFGSIDATIVGTHMVLEATERGLSSVWVAAFHSGIAKNLI